MRATIIVLAIGIAPCSAFANCFGSDAFSTCYDYGTGNTYNIQRYGNQTHMNGYNAQTGSSWSQDSYNYGTTTQHYGTDSNGNSWSTTCFSGNCY